MKKLLIVLFLFVVLQISASQDVPSSMSQLVITPNSSIGSSLNNSLPAFSPQHELCYEKIMQSRLQYQQELDVIQASLVAMDQDQAFATARFNNYSALISKEAEVVQEIKKCLSPDKAHAILKEYQEREVNNSLSPNQRARMMRMKSGLDTINVQVKIALEQVKGVTISEILSTYPCNVIYPSIQSDCIAHQVELIEMYKKNVEQSVFQQRAIAEQKNLNIRDQSIIVSFVKKMDELSQTFVENSPVHLSMIDITSLSMTTTPSQQLSSEQQLALESSQQFQAQQKLKTAKIAALSKQKASQFKNNLAGFIVDSIFEQAFVGIDKNEQMRLNNERVRLQKEHVQLREAIDNQKMMTAILTSVIDKAALVGESNIQARLKAEKTAANIAKNKALQQKKLQNKIAAEKNEEKQLELNGFLAEQVDDRLAVPEAFAAVQTAQNYVEQEAQVVSQKQFVVNRKDVVAKVIDPDKKKKDRLIHFQSLRDSGFIVDELKSEMARYDEYVHKFEITTVNDFLLDFQKMLTPDVLQNQSSWQYFLQTMDGLKKNACDLDIDENGKAIINRKITELFNILYPKYGHYNAELIDKHINNQELKIKSCNNNLWISHKVLNQTKDARSRIACQLNIKKLQTERAQASELFDEATRVQNMFYVMTKLRKLQIFGGVFQEQTELSPLVHVQDFVVDKFYEEQGDWVKQFETSKKFLHQILQQKSYVECSDYQILLVDQYKKINVPASDIEFVAFDAAYSILNMLESKVNIGSEHDVQHELFSYLHYEHPTYCLELIRDMTKIQMMLFVIMKKITA